jgi:hypothetical protein
MQEIDKTKPTKNPLEEHACQEPHEKSSAHPIVPYIRDDVSSSSNQFLDMIFESHSEDLEHADDEPH